MSPRTFAVAWAVLLPTIAWVGWGTATPAVAIGLIGAGLLVWTLFEYAMHRFLFHLEPRHPVLKWFVFLIHGNHHEDPNDAMRDMMPLPVSITVGAAVWIACLELVGPAGTWLLLGFMTGYVIYDSIHYACHQWPMRGRIGSALKRHHMRHHFIDDTGNYAISAIFWDRLLNTRVKSNRRPG